MCKRHWKAARAPAGSGDPAEPREHAPPPPIGESVYDQIIPQSIAFRPNQIPGDPELSLAMAGSAVMPLIAFLRENSAKPPGA